MSIADKLNAIVDEIKRETNSDLWLNYSEQWFLLCKKMHEQNIVIDVGTRFIITADKHNRIIPFKDVVKIYPILQGGETFHIITGSVDKPLNHQWKNIFYRITEWLFANGQWKNNTFYNEGIEKLQNIVDLKEYEKF